MRNSHGERFLCTVPTPPPPPPEVTTPEQDLSKEDLDKIAERGLELLQPLENKCIIYPESWWTYKYCHQKDLQQYHVNMEGDNTEGTMIFYLGRFKEPSSKEPLARVQSIAGKKYLVQHWSDGTNCDLNGKPRTTEIQFHCNPNVDYQIAEIKEVSTCNYLMVILTSDLCKDPLFTNKEASLHHTIQCEPMDAVNRPLDQASTKVPPNSLDSKLPPTKNPHPRIHILNAKDGRQLADRLVAEIIRAGKDKQKPSVPQADKLAQHDDKEKQQEEEPRAEL
ncbi:hypothetical protein K493DRAFT_313600 [Basidiobolus meristosporus CBS 931.73]|uniref:Protein OS-9 homolog n=1 Tax=Basidiobolus meristosporus CBS 931.73 TaxID=1314790 RepID=A0A1Y1YKS2_9FUNG|nr:hypothetical protein K493DRAFT_313600 [Basidiobolus meristosporus CBS 931.73]|eukprot:ORX98589.1 hypothetical protein K493DRAFT_313600 [Basidiobolus meristosporus CBS 931.73]